MGARTDAEHQWIDPSEYVCGVCLAPQPLSALDPPADAVEALGRARTAQERAGSSAHPRVPFTSVQREAVS